MQPSKKDYWRGKGTKAKTICTKCNRHYEQAVYMKIDKKMVKIGEGCPECLRKFLSEGI